MAVYKRKGSDIYYMDFTIFRTRIFRSTGKTEKEEARKVEEQERQRILASSDDEFDLSFTFLYGRDRYLRNRMKPIEVRVRKLIGNRRGSLLGEKDVDRFIERLRQEGATNATINSYLTALRKAFRHAGIRVFIPPNLPTDRRERILSTSEEALLLSHLAAFGHRHMKDLIVLLLHTGMKLSEALALTPGCFTQDRSSVQVWHDQHRQRYIPVDDAVKEIFERRKRFTRGMFKISAKKVEYEWAKARTALGLSSDRSFLIGALRHTYAFRLIQQGADAELIKDRLGFSSLKAAKAYMKRVQGVQDDSPK